MNPLTHLLASGLLTEAVPGLGRRDRALVVAAGVIPDFDGLGAIVELATRDTERPLLWFSQYHHALHDLGLFLPLAALTFALARRRWPVLLLVTVAFHLHLLFDIAGARGPDGSQWPIPYLAPFSAEPRLAWEGQWALDAWPNIAFTALLVAATLLLARTRGRSVLGLFSQGADRALVEALRGRFPLREGGPRPGGA